MITAVLAILVGYLAAVGLVEICATMGRWMNTTATMERCWVVVTACQEDPLMEARLRQAWSQVANNPALDGAQMVVAQVDTDGEAMEICRCFCREKGVALVEKGELEELMLMRRGYPGGGL